jgi:hypothetical protein
VDALGEGPGFFISKDPFAKKIAGNVEIGPVKMRANPGVASIEKRLSHFLHRSRRLTARNSEAVLFEA